MTSHGKTAQSRTWGRTMDVGESQLIVSEDKPLWARLFRPIAQQAGIQLQEVRGLTQLRQAVAAAPASVVGIQVTRLGLIPGLTTIRWIKQNSAATVIAMIPREVAPWTWSLREFGSDQIVVSPLDLQPTAWIVKRHVRLVFESRQASRPTAGSYREQVWRQLPWIRHATGGGG